MTRADLLQVFKPQWGLSTPTRENFMCRRCYYFVVGVEFTPYQGGAESDRAVAARYDERDVIKGISPSYVSRQRIRA